MEPLDEGSPAGGWRVRAAHWLALNASTVALLASTAVFSVFAFWYFGYSERRAWRLGRIEEQTGA